MAFSEIDSLFEELCSNKDYSKLMMDYSETKFKVKKTHFNATSNNNEDLLLQSTKFPSHRDAPFLWQVDFHPLGYTKDADEGFTSIYLMLRKRKVKMPINAQMRFEIINEKNEIIVSDDQDYVYDDYNNYGFSSFCEIYKLSSMLGDFLTIRTQVWAYYEAYSCSTSNFASERELLHNYSNLLENQAFYDLIIYVKRDSAEFKVHKAILSSRSKVFAAMLSNNMKENITGRIDIDDFSSTAVKGILNFIYSCEVNFEDTEKTQELLEAAEKYDLTNLKMQCIEYLASSIDENNIAQILILADRLHIEKLKSDALSYIGKHRDKFTDDEQFRILDGKIPNILIEVISRLLNYHDES